MPTPIATGDIVTLAFLAMEKTPPASFADETEEAAQSAALYQTALDRCLERGDWSFASTWANLPPLVPAPTVPTDPALPYTYALPGDCVRLREVGDGTQKWRVDRLGDVTGIRANQSGNLAVRYTARIEAEALLPVAFRQAVALQLAVYLAPKYLGTSSKVDTLKRDLAMAIEDAQREDSRTASEARYDGLPDQSDWVMEARR